MVLLTKQTRLRQTPKNKTKLMAKDSANTSFWDHLDVLRGTIIKIALATVVCSVLAFFLKDELFAIILAPKNSHFITYQLTDNMGRWFGADGMEAFSVNLVNTGLAEQFAIHMKVALYVGALVASPYTLYLLVGFISPALYASEKRYTYPVVIGGYVMFVIGMALNYFLISLAHCGFLALIK